MIWGKMGNLRLKYVMFGVKWELFGKNGIFGGKIKVLGSK